MATYWFRPKRYGYGATPNTWQGWTATIAVVVVVIAGSVVGRSLGDKSLWSLALLLAIEVVVLGGFVIVGRRKTEGGWRWRWGDR